MAQTLPVPTQPASLRDQGREQVYSAIVATPGVTRSEVSDRLSMSRSAVTYAVSRLLAEGRISETGAEGSGPGSGSGRPASRLHAVGPQQPVAGLDFGHNHIAVAIASGDGEILAERRVTLMVDDDAAAAVRMAAAMLTDLRAGVALSAVVAGIPGPIDARSGLVTSHTILSGWVGHAPAAELSDQIGVAVHVQNDAVLGAFGELRCGAGRDHDDFLYVKASHGIGAALVLDGRPFTGSTGIAGEIGHTRLPLSTELCRCGDRGCLEAEVSVQSLRRQLRHTHPGASEDDVSDLSRFADPVSERIFNDAGRTIGHVLAGSCNLINPSAVIIGGELGSASPALVAGIRASIDRAAQPATAQAVTVVAAELGDRAELVGAVQLGITLARR